VKVILTETVPSLGTIGQVVEVARGYARNYLIPQGKALEATPGNVSRFEAQRTRLARLAAKEREEAQALAARLAEVVLTIPQKVGESDRLYGSVTTAMIAAALEEKGFSIDRKDLEIPEPIKKLGSYSITARLAPEVKAQIQVEVVPEAS
jgi:large subunit ribosomal protein L9